MKKRFIYHDEKSNKFWWIDYEGDSLAVNYGKVGSIRQKSSIMKNSV